ncbi:MULTISPECIES: lipase family protein [unclassified Rhodococcus (in: high G+C Gram-positive bacteria)]|uniref:alpha/beta hydrolase family protein n=1 Tax=unclassified Rhodococcus (in: high G+C Gram-positive bacteria) TaxID=192944 RepID=UPI0011EDCEAE|nr:MULTISPECIES: lipase family protein [unclassified Rhodococcus (in: high G+C Gram-positive bacteria)]KAA0924618.1 lipase [Rhodococcus sp. ANT_H53B]MDI9926171.1 lipase family protein [Rhodococcus sp. IEGM 1341]
MNAISGPNRARRVGAVLAASTCALVGCSSPPAPSVTVTPAETTTAPAPQYDFTGVPGTVLDSEDFGDRSTELSATGATLYRFVYESTSGVDNSPTAVSGVAAVPAGTPPAGGWPTVVYGHGTTGIQADCGPTLYPDLLGYQFAVQDFTELGYVTVLPDYQGLGTGGGTHPYLEPRTSGHNMIDAARAAQSALPDMSTRWAAVGLSQGGQAAWAANELAATYGQGLDLVGSVSLSPPTDLTPLVQAATDGNLTRPQKELLPYLLYGAQQVDPTIDPMDYSGSVAEANNELLLTCSGGDTEGKERAVEAMTPDEFAADSAQSEQQLLDVIGRYTLPQVRTEVPMFVAYGAKDDIVLPQWTADGVQKACALGDPIVAQEQPEQGHDVSDEAAMQFLAAVFAGQSVPSTC